MLPPILPIIIYHGERKFSATIRFGKLIRPVKGFEKYTLDFESLLLDLTQTDEDALAGGFGTVLRFGRHAGGFSQGYC